MGGNALASLPDLRPLRSLRELDARHNRLAVMPALPHSPVLDRVLLGSLPGLLAAVRLWWLCCLTDSRPPARKASMRSRLCLAPRSLDAPLSRCWT